MPTLLEKTMGAGHREAGSDKGHIGDIKGAFGTIRRGDVAPRHTWRARWQTFLAILGPGLIVTLGDNDAGAFSTYAQAAQTTATRCCGR